MEKLKSLLTSKKFWTLVSAIVAALSAFFLTSCVSSGSVFRRGVHHDTVEYWFKIRSRNFQTVASCPTTQFDPIRPLSIPTSFLSTPAFGTSTECAFPMSSTVELFVGLSLPQNGPFLDCRLFSSPSSFMRSITFTTSIPSCSEDALSLSNPRCPTFGEKCLIAFVPIAFLSRSRRRGGRKGRPRPSTKTVPLGGSHL